MQVHREAQIILPHFTNSGVDLNDTHLLLRKELTETFGGVTMQSAMGTWKTPTGQHQTEPVYLFTIAYKPSAECDAILLDIAATYAGLAEQIVVYVRKANGEVTFVEPKLQAAA